MVYAQDIDAQDIDVGYSQIHPASPFYFLKGVRESLEMALAQTPRVRMLRQLEYSNRRLRETKSLLREKREDLIQATLERYWYHFNEVLIFRPRDEDLTLTIRHYVDIHLKEFDKIYNQLSSQTAKMAIRANINRLMEKSDVSGEVRVFGCNFLLKESSSSALTEVERMVLGERAESCFEKLKPIR